MVALLARALAARAVGPTACNERSSRSHLVFMLRIEGVNATLGARCAGTLNLVDLAGSERLSRSQVQGERLRETQARRAALGGGPGGAWQNRVQPRMESATVESARAKGASACGPPGSVRHVSA